MQLVNHVFGFFAFFCYGLVHDFFNIDKKNLLSG